MTAEQKLKIIADYMRSIEGLNISAELIKASVEAILAMPLIEN
jgi:hypothetical protein